MKLMRSKTNNFDADLDAITLDGDPAIVEARATLGRVQAELNAVGRDIDAIYAESGVMLHADKLTAAAEAVLAGVAVKNHVDIDTRMDSLRQRQVVLRKAVELAQRRLGGLISKRSQEISEAVRPQHQKLAAKVAQLTIALAEASEEERAFRMSLEDKGIDYGSHIESFSAPVGSLKEHGSRASSLLREMVRYGAIAKSEVPQTIW